MKSRWKQQTERSNRFMLSLLVWIALRLGRSFMRLLLYPIVLYFVLTAKQARRASQQYLKKVFNVAPHWSDVFRHFYTFALVSVDRLFFLCGRFDRFQIDIHGRELINQYTSGTQGCLLLAAHLGSFEVLRVHGARKSGLPIRVLMDRQHNAKVMQLIDALDPVLARDILDVAVSAPALALAVSECVKQGGLVGIMADRAAPGERVIVQKFLNNSAAFPVGPWLLSLTLNVPVILCVGLYEGGNRYSINFELISDKRSIPRKQREQALANLTECFARRLEFYTRLSPYNWFNFYNFWLDETTTNN